MLGERLQDDVDFEAGPGASGSVVIWQDLERNAMGCGVSIYRLEKSRHGEPSRRLIPFSKFNRSVLSPYDDIIAPYRNNPDFCIPLEALDGSGYEFYNGIVNIADSLLIRKVLDRELKKDAKKFSERGVPEVLVEDLIRDFESFIEAIRKEDTIQLRKGDNVFISPRGHFRVDIGGSFEKGWTIDIQDNTGKHHHGGKSLSSVFAKATVPKGIASIEGDQLSELFVMSQAEKVAKDVSSLNTQNKSGKQVSTGSFNNKQKERSDKNKQKYLEEKERRKDLSLSDLSDNDSATQLDSSAFIMSSLSGAVLSPELNEDNPESKSNYSLPGHYERMLSPPDGTCLFYSVVIAAISRFWNCDANSNNDEFKKLNKVCQTLFAGTTGETKLSIDAIRALPAILKKHDGTEDFNALIKRRDNATLQVLVENNLRKKLFHYMMSEAVNLVRRPECTTLPQLKGVDVAEVKNSAKEAAFANNWGHVIHVLALSQMLKVPIVIMNDSEADDYDAMPQDKIVIGKEYAPARPLFLFFTGSHYDFYMDPQHIPNRQQFSLQSKLSDDDRSWDTDERLQLEVTKSALRM